MKLPPGHVPGVGLKQATAYGGLGEKLLKQYGWKEGEGLGSQGTGIKNAIKVLKKDDTIGVGGRQVVRESNTANWWQQSFDSALQNLSGAVSEENSSDSEADGFDMGHVRLNRDGTVASASAAELRLEKELAKDPWGRFGGRNGKLARIRAQEAAMAASQSGVNPIKRDQHMLPEAGSRKRQKTTEPAVGDSAAPAPEATSPPQVAKKRKRAKMNMDQSSRPDAPTANLSGQKATLNPSESGNKAVQGQDSRVSSPISPSPSKERQGKTGECKSDAAAHSSGVPSNWWGASKFVAAGCLGGLQDQEGKKARKSFTEETQEELYMKTHAAKTAGKKGLGSGQGKAVGHEWRGTKTTFSDSEPEEAGALKQANVKASSKTDSSVQSDVAVLSDKRLAKLAKRILKQEEGQQLRLSKLTKRLAKDLPCAASDDNVQSLLAQQVVRCPRLTVEGKLVRMAAKK